jgi:hypothetical protein
VRGIQQHLHFSLARNVLKNLVGVICHVRVDDVIIYARTYQSLCDNLQTVLQRLSDYELILDERHCQFGLRSIDALHFFHMKDDEDDEPPPLIAADITEHYECMQSPDATSDDLMIPHVSEPNLRMMVGLCGPFPLDIWSQENDLDHEWILICMDCYSCATVLFRMDYCTEENIKEGIEQFILTYGEYAEIYFDPRMQINVPALIPRTRRTNCFYDLIVSDHNQYQFLLDRQFSLIMDIFYRLSPPEDPESLFWSSYLDRVQSIVNAGLISNSLDRAVARQPSIQRSLQINIGHEILSHEWIFYSPVNSDVFVSIRWDDVFEIHRALLCEDIVNSAAFNVYRKSHPSLDRYVKARFPHAVLDVTK